MDKSTSNILAIDSSSRMLSLGLSFGGDRLVKTEEAVEQSHGQIIMKKIGELFESAGLERSELGAICVCTGPGSFTGLRIGLAAAKGMAVALGIRVAGVSLYELAAYKLQGVDRKVAVIIPLTRDEVFLGEVHGGKLIDDRIVVVADRDVGKLVGDGAVAGYQVDLAKRLSRPSGEDLSAAAAYDVGDLLWLGRSKLSAGAIDDLASLEPLYVQKSQAEIKYELRNKSGS